MEFWGAVMAVSRVDSGVLAGSMLQGLAPVFPIILCLLGITYLKAKAQARRREARRQQRLAARPHRPNRPSLDQAAAPSGAKRRVQDMTISDVDAITWREFEHMVAAIFRAKGMQAKATPAENDWGADVVVDGPEGRIVVQCKHWRRVVGVKAVQEVSAARSYYHADRAIVVTNSNFTRQAEDLALSCRVELWPRRRLAQELAAVKSAPNHKQAS